MKKAQAALEFLMTYGWAILVVLAAIGALAYFGVLSPSKFLPDKCVASTGFGCAGKPLIEANTGSAALNITFVIHQGLPYDVTSASYSATAAGASCARVTTCLGKANFCATNVTTLAQDQDYTVRITGCTATSGLAKDDTVKTDVTISFTNPQSGLADTAVFSVQGKAK